MTTNEIDSWVNEVMAEVGRMENTNGILMEDDRWSEFQPTEYRYYDNYCESVEDW